MKTCHEKLGGVGQGGPEKGANQDIIHPQKEGHDEMLMAKEQHAALDPNRLKAKSLNALGI